MKCPKCQAEATKIGSFWICPTHGQLSEPKPHVPMRIFLSYGHDNNEELVRRIKADLEERGHDVWFDKSEIKFGDDWRHSITDAILKSNRVLSFLSKHSTRDPGVCRDEIAIAIGVKGGNIQTILVESEQDVQPPVNIGHIQWLDMRDWRAKCDFGRIDWGNWYQGQLAEIVGVVESAESRRFAGEIETLNDHLKPIKSDARICQLLSKGFYGRQWLFEAVEKWRQDTKQDSRLFWIMGAPGVGKSAFAAQLTHTRGDTIIAAQFCEWDKPDHRTAQRVVCSLAFQLATRLPDYRKLLLTLPEITKLDSKDAAELFDYLLANPLRTAINGGRERYLIVIDALDEAGEAGRNPLVELLARNAQSLPDWLGLVVTSRPEFDVKTPLQALNPFQLDTQAESNRTDIRDYLRRELAVPLQNRPDADRIVEQILEKSEGIFLYVERFCHDVRRGHFSLDHPGQFPQGLGGIFYQYFQRLFPDLEKFGKDVRPALRVILAAREPLPVAILQRLFSWKGEELHDFAQPLASLFPITSEAGHETIKPYHKSLSDWLSDATNAGPYYSSSIEGQQVLAEEMWQQCRQDPCGMSGYALRNAVAHLASTGRVDNLCLLLCDLRFVAARCLANQVPELQMDYDIALAAAAKKRRDIMGETHLLGASSAYHRGPAQLDLVLEEHSRAFSSRSHILAREPGEVLPQMLAAMAEALPATHPAKSTIEAGIKTLVTSTWLRQENWLHCNQKTTLCRLIDQHRAAVLALAFSPNGKKVASGDAAGIILIWNIANGAVDYEVSAETGPICALSFSPDGKRLYCACSTRGVLILDIDKKTFSEIFMLAGVSSLALSDDGIFLLVADTAGGLFLMNTTSLKTERIVGNSLRGAIHCLAFCPDGCHFVSGGEDGTVRIWDWRAGAQLQLNGQHRDRVVSVAVSPDGTRIASGSRDRSIMLWDADSRKKIALMVGHRSIVSALSFVSGGSRLISGSYDRTIRLWEAATGLLCGVVAGHEGWVRSLAVSPSGDRVVSGSEDGRVKVWTESMYDGSHTQEGHSHWILRSCIAQDESRLITVGRDSRICVWDLRNESVPPVVMLGHRGWVHAVAALPGNTEICTSGNDRKVLAWDINHPHQPRALFEHTEIVRAAAAGNGWIAVGGVGSSISVWRAGFSQARRLEIQALRITDMATASNGPHLLVRCSDRSVRLVDIPSMRELRRFCPGLVSLDCEVDRRYSQSVVGCSPDGALVFAGSAEGRISVWDAESGMLVFENEVHRSGLRAACILPRDHCIATGGEDFTVRLWDLASGKLKTTFHTAAPPSSLTWLSKSGQLCLVESSAPRPRVRLFSICEPND